MVPVTSGGAEVGRTLTLVVVVLAVAAAGLWARQWVVADRLRRRLAAHRPSPPSADPPWWERASRRLAPLATRVEGIAGSLVARSSGLAALDDVVDQASLAATSTEVVAVAGVVGAAAAIGATALGAPMPVVVALAVAGAVAPPAVVAVMAARRRAAFAAELPDVLALLAGTLRAGVSLTAALEAAAGEAGGPVAPELRRVAGETALGRPLPDALAAVGRRMRSDEVGWVGMAVEIHQQAGGNLAEVLDTVARTVAERQQLRREVAALTAEGRISAVVLGVLPVGLAGVIAVVNPGYLATLVETRIGTTLVVGAAVGMLAGFVWMRRIVDVEV